MNVLGVNVKSPKQSKRSRSKGVVKVVYISSPMKVQTSASEFRALVQELTGRDSDAERFMETNNGGQHQQQNVHEDSHDQQLNVVDDYVLMPQLPFQNSSYEYPNCASDSLFKLFSGEFGLDVLTSYDQL
ncbi:hypothetical protein ACFX15_027846 [Malus domestica]|uniref:uncharacterized protein LOC126599395 n=1 Tax=Malus sylvestris TaxID=3752 RepID=UPI0021ACBF8A|nr:uncharacterized protein LOC126599395 [Malus sylvestris]